MHSCSIAAHVAGIRTKRSCWAGWRRLRCSFKTAYLALLAALQLKFAFGNQASLSQRLFEIYLRQLCPFHLRRNSAELIRNSITESTCSRFSVLIPPQSRW